MQIDFFASDKKLLQYFNLSGCGEIIWEPWRHERPIRENLLLICPIKMENTFISCEQSWKNYLEQECPETIFVTAGFTEAEHSNYIDLLNPTQDLSLFFQKAAPAKADWTPVDTGGLDMKKMMKSFLDGHGDVSIRQEFTSILITLKIAEDSIRSNPGTDFDQIKLELLEPAQVISKWQSLKNRWSSYYPYFECLPYYSVFQEISQLLSGLSSFFEDGGRLELSEELNCSEKLDRIRQLLNTCTQYA